MALSKPLKNPPAHVPQSSEKSFGERAIPLLLIASILATFWPLFLADFVKWDDHRDIVINAWLNPPTFQKMVEFWNPKHPYMDIWIPLTYTIWSAIADVSYVQTPDPDTGAHLNPWIFHGANLVVHVISVLVVYAILRRATGKLWPAAAGAALFAIHPVQVEPVGWVSGMKDVLAGCLGLIATWQYLMFAWGTNDRGSNKSSEIHLRSGATAGPPRPREEGAARTPYVHYALATGAFILAMLAKPSGIVVPLVVGVLDLFLVRRRIKSVILWLLPWVLLTYPIIREGRYAQPALHAPKVAIALRPLIAADSLAFYIFKLVFPLKLGIVYNHSPQTVLEYHWAFYTWIVPAAVLVALWIYRKRFPWLIAAVGVYWLAVSPVLGLVPFDFQSYSTVADHYLYLAMLGPALALGMALRNIRSRAMAVAVWMVILLFAARAFVQTWVWHDTLSLLGHAVKVNPYACSTYYNLAATYREKHDYPKSIATFEEGLQYNPDCVVLRINYADILDATDQPEKARREYEKAAQKASPSELWIIQKSLEQMNQKQSAATQKAPSSAHLTPATSPIK